MRPLLLLLAAAAAPAVRAADLPPVVVQFAPRTSLLADLRGMARAVGGEAAVKSLDDWADAEFGLRGLGGFDLTRPVVVVPEIRPSDGGGDRGYVVAPLADEARLVDGLKAFGKGGDVTPVPGRAGAYTLTDKGKPDDPQPVHVRVRGGFVYVGSGMPAAAFDPAALPTYDQLVTAGETAPVSVRVRPGRVPDAMWTAALVAVAGPGRPAADDAEAVFRRAAAGYLTRLREADRVTARLAHDPAAHAVTLDIRLAPRPGTPLARDVAAFRPTPNRFGGLIGPAAAAGLAARLPLFGADARDAAAGWVRSTVDTGLRAKPQPDDVVQLFTAVRDGLVRTVRGGEVDAALAVTGPDAGGRFTFTGAVAFDDPSTVERHLRAMAAAKASPRVRELLTLDAAKAGAVNVHVMTLGPALPPDLRAMVGDAGAAAFALAPKGVYVALGPDPVPALTAALAANPPAARLADAVVNPRRLGRLVAAVGPDAAAEVTATVGDDDEPRPAVSVAVEGGAELRLRAGMDLRVLPRAAFVLADRKAPTP